MHGYKPPFLLLSLSDKTPVFAYFLLFIKNRCRFCFRILKIVEAYVFSSTVAQSHHTAVGDTGLCFVSNGNSANFRKKCL